MNVSNHKSTEGLEKDIGHLEKSRFHSVYAGARVVTVDTGLTVEVVVGVTVEFMLEMTLNNSRSITSTESSRLTSHFSRSTRQKGIPRRNSPSAFKKAP